MKRFLICGASALVCLCLLLPGPAFSGGCFSYYCAFNEEKAVVTKNGADIGGRVFTKTYDPEPDELFVLAPDAAFLLRTKGLFMQRFGTSNVSDVTVHNTDDKGKPVTIDYEVGIAVAGAVLEETGKGKYAFAAGDDRYEVRLKRAVKRDPDMFTNLLGSLVSKTERVGTRSEGPEYYLWVDGGREIHVIKNATPWEDDPELQEVVGGKVWVLGTLVDGELVYKTVGPNLK